MRWQTLIEHWNGKKWKIVLSPNPGQYSNFLTSVAKISAKKIWAVGFYYDYNVGPFNPLIEFYC